MRSRFNILRLACGQIRKHIRAKRSNADVFLQISADETHQSSSSFDSPQKCRAENPDSVDVKFLTHCTGRGGRQVLTHFTGLNRPKLAGGIQHVSRFAPSFKTWSCLKIELHSFASPCICIYPLVI